MSKQEEQKIVTGTIIGTGHYLPEDQLTNENLYQKLKREGYQWVSEFKDAEEFAKWAYRVSGVRSRCFAPEGQSAEDLAAYAAKKALEDAGISGSEIGRIILNTVTPAWLFPAAGIRLQEMIGARDAASDTINQACSGFVWGMVNACNLVKAGYNKPILVVSADTLSRVRSIFETRNCILFSDGAAACVIKPSKNKGFLGEPFLRSLYSLDITLDGAYGQFLFKGRSVVKAAIDGMATMAKETLKTTGYNINDLAYIIPHQANGRFVKGIAEHLKIAEEKIINIIENVGNNSGATVGIALDMLRKGKILKNGISLRLKENDLIVFTAIGAGYTEAAIAYQV